VQRCNGASHGYCLLTPTRPPSRRYAILYDQGGYYADIDVECTEPIDNWLADHDNYDNVEMVVGFEVVTDREDWADWFARPIQLCQW
jgi:mannosyltransferase OCH1-like enzyme